MDVDQNTTKSTELSRRGVVVGAAALSAAAVMPQSAAAAPAACSGVVAQGFSVYKTQSFLDAMNANYTAAAMPGSIAKIIAAGYNPATIEWGEYQTILTPPKNWPAGIFARWLGDKDAARQSLANQPNTEMSYDGTTPTTRCALLDAAVQRCFSSTHPIAISIDVGKKAQTDPTCALHDIKLIWTNDANGNPAQLSLTMICPWNS